MTVRLLSLLALACALSACETDLSVNLGDDPSHVVVNGQFQPDSVWTIWLHRSTPYVGVSPPIGRDSVTDASVSVTDLATGERTELPHVGLGIYRATSSPERGRAYVLDVRLPDGITLTAQSTTPARPEIGTTPVAFAFTDDRGVDQYRTTFRIGAPVTGDYAALAILREGPDGRAEPTYFTTDDPDLRAGYFDDAPVRNYTGVYDGVYLRPLSAPRTLEVEFEVYERGRTDTVYVRLRSLSPELQAVLAATALQEDRGGNAFVPPVSVPTNIQGGGIGVFAGFDHVVVPLAVPPPR